MATAKKVMNVTGVTLTKSDFEKLKLTFPNYKRALADVLYYTHYQLSIKDLAKETAKYAKTNPDFKKAPLSQLPDYRYAIVGKYCFILNKGGELEPELNAKIHSMLADLCGDAIAEHEAKKIQAQAETKQDTQAEPVLTIQDRLKLKAAEVCVEFDGEIDEFTKNPTGYDIKKFNPTSTMNRAQLKQGHLRYVIGFYENDIRELNELLEGNNPDLSEAYSYLSRTNQRKLKKMFEEIVNGANMIITQTKANRAPPKRKAKPIEKIIEKLKYKKQDSDLKIASISPADILGAKTLWVYNTKTRKIGMYTAFDELGLSIKGTSLDNYSIDNSKQKTLRKPEENIQGFTKGTRASYDKNFKGIKAIDTKMSPRINENVVLLKVFK